MPETQKIVRGGFRATVALIISIIALVIAVVAYDRSGDRPDPTAQITDLKAKIEKMKQETSQRIDKIREESAKTLDKMSKVLKKEVEEQQQ
jgi:hypothetical protein